MGRKEIFLERENENLDWCLHPFQKTKFQHLQICSGARGGGWHPGTRRKPVESWVSGTWLPISEMPPGFQSWEVRDAKSKQTHQSSRTGPNAPPRTMRQDFNRVTCAQCLLS